MTVKPTGLIQEEPLSFEYPAAGHCGVKLRELAASVGGWLYENGSGQLVFEDYSQRDPAVVSIPKLRLSDVPEDGFGYVIKDFNSPAASLANTVKVGSYGDVHALPGPSDANAKVVWSLEPASIALSADALRIFFADYVSEDDALGGLIARRAGAFALPNGGWAADDGVGTPYLVNYGRSGEVVLKAPGGGQTAYRLLIGARPQNRQTTERAFITVGSGQPIMEAGGFDQRESNHFYGCRPPYLPLAARPDVLVFQTEPLEEDLEVTGPISVRLWIDSSAADTDFTAKLLDVYPPSQDYPEGYALNLTDGIFRCKFRNSWEEPELMEPGEVYAVTIELMPTSNLFLAGHRIRLDVSSSNFPRFDVNGNTGENPGRSPVKVSAKNQVYHDAERPSHVMLPIIPVVG